MLNKLKNYLKESQIELAKVVWPQRKQLARLTAVVIAVTVAVGVYLGMLDYVFSKLLGIVAGR